MRTQQNPFLEKQYDFYAGDVFASCIFSVRIIHAIFMCNLLLQYYVPLLFINNVYLCPKTSELSQHICFLKIVLPVENPVENVNN